MYVVPAQESAGRVILPSMKCSPGAYRQLAPTPLHVTYPLGHVSEMRVTGPCGSACIQEAGCNSAARFLKQSGPALFALSGRPIRRTTPRRTRTWTYFVRLTGIGARRTPTTTESETGSD